uniref:Cysteine protease n=1 Tax=Hydra vulgaris TaxID=6087 RepID=T2M7B1_HYDVU
MASNSCSESNISNKVDHFDHLYESDESSDEDFFQGAHIKTKIISAWNNVKYGFNVPYKPSFDSDSPIWLLGRCYYAKQAEYDSKNAVQNTQYKIHGIDCFFEDFSSLIYLSYRKHFSQLANSNLTSDSGWGCMLRTGQMLLANALLIHMLKEGWRISERKYTEKNYIYRMILRFFNDENSDNSPFSLHELVRIGSKKPGEWYGPTSVAHTLSAAVNLTSHPVLDTFRVYVANDCTVYIKDVISTSTKCKNCTKKTCQEKFWRSMLILVPIRLGSDGLNPIYIPCLKALLTLDYCVGIIGGRPKHSLYFVGFQGKKLINLDPHYLQEYVDMTTQEFPVESFRCHYPKKMAFKKMDPSCAVGFYCRTREDFESLCKQAVEMLKPPMQRTEYPMFIFDDGSSFCSDEPDGLSSRDQMIEISYNSTKKSKKKIKSNEFVEEYVLVE